MRVLVVDGHSVARRVTRQYLESFGCRSESAGSAEAALEAYAGGMANDPFSLIVISVGLPDADGIETAVRIKKDARFHAPPIILVLTTNRQDDIWRVTASGVEAFIIKPVKASALLDAIMNVFGEGDATRTFPDAGIRSTSGEATDVAVLLVEDNSINRRVAAEMLKTLGIRVDFADSGRQALDMLKTGRYDAVLMDIQMPGMDGFQTTRNIREELGLWTLPIIAMTANVLSGNREKCLAAGMNDYIPKPVEIGFLHGCLKRWIPGLKNRSPSPTVAPQTEKTDNGYNGIDPLRTGLDYRSGMVRLGGNAGIYRKLLREFVDKYTDESARIREALERGDRREALERIHAIKGVAGNLSARNVYAGARELERNIAEEKVEFIQGDIVRFDNSLKELALILQGFLDDTPPGDVRSGADGEPMADRTPVNSGDPTSAIAELADLLGKNSLRAEYCLWPLRGYDNMAAHKDIIDRLEKQIGNFDFPGARQTLEQLVREMGLTLEDAES